MGNKQPLQLHFSINKGDCLVHLYEQVENDNTVYHLVWADGVANSWEEWYPTLATALARCATLAKCGETNFVEGFVSDEVSFRDNAERFLESEVA